MRSKKILLLVLGLSLGLTGCISFQATESTTETISFSKIDSALIRIGSVQLDRKDGVATLSGKVLRNSPALDQDTAHSHLLITLHDAQGNTTREITAEFEPRKIPRRHRMPGYATFHVILNVIPPEITRIEVQARDETESDASITPTQ